MPLAPALTATAGVGALLIGIDARHVVATPMLVGAGLLVAVPTIRKMVPAGTFRLARGLPAIIGTRGVLTTAFVAVDAFIPLAITDVRGRSVLMGSLAVSASTIAWTAGAWLADRWMPRRGAPWLIRVGFALLTVGNLLTLLLLRTGIPMVVGVVGATVAGLGIGTGYSPGSAAVLDLATPGEEGRTSSALALFDGLGFAIGAAITGALVAGAASGTSPGGRLAVAWAASAVVAAIGVVAAGRTVARRGNAPVGTVRVPRPIRRGTQASRNGVRRRCERRHPPLTGCTAAGRPRPWWWPSACSSASP